jgi:hypothetical protein
LRGSTNRSSICQSPVSVKRRRTATVPVPPSSRPAGTQFDPAIVAALDAIGPARPASGEVVRGVLARLETPNPAL